MVDMDWNALLGEGGQEQMDQILASVRGELLASGIPEKITYPIYVVPYIMDATQGFLSESYIKNKLGENSNFNVTIPVADILMYTIESYLYSAISFQKTYTEVVTTLQAINPEATVILLGQYNPYAGVEISLGGVTVSLDELYGYATTFLTVPSILYARENAKTIYVEVSATETVYTASEGAYDWMDVLTDPTLTYASEAGHAYICDQILASLIVSCEHVYDDCVDADCNRCGETRDYEF